MPEQNINTGKSISGKILIFIVFFALMNSQSFGIVTVTVGNQTDISSAMSPGDTDNGMLSFSLSMDNKGAAPTFTDLTIKLTGTAVSADISAVKVWQDAGAAGFQGTGTDTEIGSGTFSSNPVTISLGTTLTKSTTIYFYVSYDIASGATASNTAGAEITSLSSINTTGTEAGGSFPHATVDQSLPVELSSWTASSSTGTVELVWITESEIENQGFLIERASTSLRSESSAGQAGSATDWEEIASFITHPELLGQGSTTDQTIYTFTDSDVAVGEIYTYRLADVDYVSTITYHAAVSVTVKYADELQYPENMQLKAAYPNPFNPLVNLGFELETGSDLELSIYDVQGRLVQTIARGHYSAGSYSFQWDGTDFSGTPQSSGVYLVRLTSANESRIQRVTLIR